MSLKSVELESLGKSFSLFFLSLSLLTSLLFYINYDSATKELSNNIYTQMRLCSFDLKCQQFEFDFVQIDTAQTYQLHTSKKGPFALFNIANNTNYLLKLLYPKKNYHDQLKKIKMQYLYNYLLILLLLACTSALFSWYTLRPLRQSLRLSDEFIKDILHDFNTPLSSLRLNSSLLLKEYLNNKKLIRIEQAIQTILNLQNNLKSYIDDSPLQNETIELKTLLEDRVSYFSDNYPQLHFEVEIDSMQVHANVDALTRIIDNLISNAAKYNHKDGSIFISLNQTENILSIRDTGKGIKYPKKVFERFYKENERGLGIGLHIVKKLCEALNIPIELHSELGVGSVFTLNIKSLKDKG